MKNTNTMKDMKKALSSYLETELKPNIEEYDKSGEFPKEIYDGLIKMGVHLLEVPEKFGGLQQDRKTEVYIAETLGRYDAGLGSAIGASNSAASTINMFGNEGQKEAYFKIMTDGKLAAFCLTEPDAGSDAANVRTTAVLDLSLIHI